jgi:RNA polymerase sigma-70 factor (ECF subfamily)
MTVAAMREAVVRHQRRVWGLCYRLTGRRAAADELAQEALTRALERAEQLAAEEKLDGWLFRVATTTCLDWMRRQRTQNAHLRIVDPLEELDVPFEGGTPADEPLARKEDVRLAVLTTLQRLSPRQRAVLVLRDVLDRSSEETARALGTSEGNVRVALHRARAALAETHGACDGDAEVDPTVVERFARAIEAADLAALRALLDDHAWGLVDDGDPRRRPTLGGDAIAKQFANAARKFGRPDDVQRVRVNGEPAIFVRVAGTPIALIHLESRGGLVISLRVLRDLSRLVRFAAERSEK